jgi:hypothetical protein
MLNEDIIPITFHGGTGGNFLCHLIVSAKINNQKVIKLSKHGNAHNGMQDLLPPSVGLFRPDEEKINFLLSQIPDTSIIKPYYVVTHIGNINMLNKTFKKSIRIIYDQDDIGEIVAAYYGKWAMDVNSSTLDFSSFSPKISLWLLRYLPNFRKMSDMPNVLFISWKELFKLDMDELIAKISTFTSINAENFSKDSIVHWREKTQYCLDTFIDSK